MSDTEELLQLATVLKKLPSAWYTPRYEDLLRRVAKRIERRVDNLPTSPEAIMVAALFNRRLTTPWSKKEIESFKACVKRGVITEESMQAIGRYYAIERPKGSEGRHRRELFTFLNNFDGELDRANLMPKPRNSVRPLSASDPWPPVAKEWVLERCPNADTSIPWSRVPADLRREFERSGK